MTIFYGVVTFLSLLLICLNAPALTVRGSILGSIYLVSFGSDFTALFSLYKNFKSDFKTKQFKALSSEFSTFEYQIIYPDDFVESEKTSFLSDEVELFSVPTYTDSNLSKFEI